MQPSELQSARRPSRPRSPDLTRVSRRAIVGGLFAGAASLLAACGTGAPRASNPPSLDRNLPVAAPGGPAVSNLAEAPPTAIASGASVPPTATAMDPFLLSIAAPPSTATAAPALSPTAVNTVAPTATATAIPSPTATPLPTATPIPYVAARLTDLLGQSVTSYAGSIPSRAHNVQLATRKINGAKVAPGQVFSFDDAVGDQTESGGFQQAYGIISNNGVPETVKADAGGICQVATTVFQAVYWAGLPIVKRFHHLYWIDHYGNPPYGMIGLDATVDFPPVDFQFLNNTDDWVRVDASYDSTHVHIRLVGVDPGWKIVVGKPQIDNLVKADRTTVIQPDPTMPAGRELWIEAAQDGFDVTIDRTVTKGGQTVDHYVFTNHYDPARNVKAVGTLGATPTAAKTAAPSTTPSPATAGTATAAPPTATSQPAAPAPAAPAGQVKVPSVIGLPEAQARQVISSLGLQNTYTNYQGAGDVPASALSSVPVGAVLSQTPAPGSLVAPGTTVYIAVRKN